MKKLLHIQTSLQHNTYKIGSVLAPVFRARVTLLCMLMVLSVAQSYAGLVDWKFYATLTAKVTSDGGGTVVVSDQNTDPGSGYGSTSSKQGITKTSGSITKPDVKSADVTLYAYAQANEGYSFDGWYYSETGGNKEETKTQFKWTVTSEAYKGLVGGMHNTEPKLTIYARFVKNSAQTVTFIQATNGSYTVSDANDSTKTITNGGTLTADNFNLKATPKQGYKFFGWYTTTDYGATKDYFSYNDSTTKSFQSAVSVGADFVSNDTPIFIVKSAPTIKYKDLNAADNAAGGSGTIVLISDGTLPAGNYTISKGNTLLIPYDEAYTVSTTKAAVVTEKDGWQKLSVYKTLNLANGANITVQSGAAISVGGKQFSTSNQMGSAGGPGTPTGPYGCINMSKGGNITLQSGSFLYAWGFITGQNMDQGNNTTGVGTIDAQNGATVYEDIVIADWHGGSATSGMDSKKKYFPFNQYFIPNIEVPLTINYGATLNAISDIFAGYGSFKYEYSVPITFIAEKDGLFNMLSENSTIKIWYDATDDTQHFELTGDNNIKGIKANVSFATVDASNYVMPMTCNFDIHIKSGSITIPSDIALLPGAKVTLDEGVTATINQGVNVYIYDLDNWGLYSYNNYRKVYPFRPTKFKKYGQGDSKTKAADVAKVTGLSDAKLVVNGKLTVNGTIYTTNAGADICNDGTGSIVFATAPTATSTTYQYVHGGNPAEVAIPVTAAQLHNADGSYVKTAGTAANSTYYYNNGVWSLPPTFSYNDKGHSEFTLSNAATVTPDQVKTEIGNNKDKGSVLSVDLTNVTGNIDIASLRSTIDEATKNSNVLLYVPATVNANNVPNVVIKGADGKYTASNFVITDKQPIDVPTAFTATNASYSRANTKNAGDTQWGTICLPYAVKSDGNIQYYQLSGISKDGNTMTFEKVPEVGANQPAIYSVASSVNSLSINGGGTNVAVSATENKPVTDGGFTLVGVQTTEVTTLTNGSNNYYIAQNKFWQPTGTDVNVRPQRAYFTFVTNGSANQKAKVFSIGVVEDGGTTGIDSTPWDGNEPTVVGIYTVGGMRLNSLQPGINILRMSDGTTKKVIIKNK